MISASTFIRNNQQGAFCLWESLATFLAIPLIEDISIVDLGSTDGTFEILVELASFNDRIQVYRSEFSCVDAKAFADAANQCVQLWKHPVGIFWQADEILHQNLVKRLSDAIYAGADNLALWRYQLRENFQKIKWFPHPVHRLGKKDSFNFQGDGMNTDSVFGVNVCSDYDMGWFTKWGDDFKANPETLPTRDMVLDVSLVGAFRDNIINRRNLHAPMWHEPPTIEGEDADSWIRRELKNPNWTKTTTGFDIPKIMKWHLGKTSYTVNTELMNAISLDTTQWMVL